MKKRALGNTGLLVSEIAFGGVEIGMPYGIGVQSEKDMLSRSEVIYLLHTALDEGINFFDTARLYGQSEILIGQAFKDRRDKVVLETKCRHLRDGNKILPSKRKLKQVIESSIKESLQALQTDYVDVYMLHDANSEILSNDEVICTFSDLKKAGVIRATGISTYTPEETSFVIESGNWDVIQVPFNLMDQRQKELFPTASKKGIGIVVRSVLLKGLLSDRGKNLHPALKSVENHIEQYRHLIGDAVPDLPTLATKFALSFNEVSSILVGIDKVEYLNKSVAASDSMDLSTEFITKTNQLAFPDPEFLNLHEWDVNGWLK